MIYKYFWALRALLYAPFFGKFALPSYLGRPLFLMGTKKVFIDKKVRIFPHLRMEVHRSGNIHIREDVVISQNVHITSAGNLVIGKSSLILANVFITNIDHEYEEIGKHVVNQEYKIRDTMIGENCYIGMGAAIMAGTKLGKQCIVGANSVVRGEFPDYCVIVGAPARIVKKYNPETGQWEKFS
ncbi:acetyltransferase-like isoleucine patch superfamily enzyme [Chryseobacterium defluvii]|uniref:Acetyltransferase-like isoleucine patch superfamily enzyme n=1 Tax=Chryseobacterium defluvii TaxID=160396 RepID=A0A840KJU6_9FLAO|nr:acyltransferase [Chryseobacterium defluvii]MBB4807783.1 acetyltransferase-like isoleucine patch superfamily enzyme [Chryseobacterium defluvii]